jgi:hypothetical protein
MSLSLGDGARDWLVHSRMEERQRGRGHQELAAGAPVDGGEFGVSVGEADLSPSIAPRRP